MYAGRRTTTTVVRTPIVVLSADGRILNPNVTQTNGPETFSKATTVEGISAFRTGHDPERYYLDATGPTLLGIPFTTKKRYKFYPIDCQNTMSIFELF